MVVQVLETVLWSPCVPHNVAFPLSSVSHWYQFLSCVAMNRCEVTIHWDSIINRQTICWQICVCVCGCEM